MSNNIFQRWYGLTKQDGLDLLRNTPVEALAILQRGPTVGNALQREDVVDAFIR